MNRLYIVDVLHVPKLQANLLLVNKFLSNGLKVRFHVNECIVGGLGLVLHYTRRNVEREDALCYTYACVFSETLYM